MTNMSTTNSLLQEVLRPQAFGVDRLNMKLSAASLSRSSSPTKQMAADDSDDELIGVVSMTTTRAWILLTTSCAYRHLSRDHHLGRPHHRDSHLVQPHPHVSAQTVDQRLDLCISPNRKDRARIRLEYSPPRCHSASFFDLASETLHAVHGSAGSGRRVKHSIMVILVIVLRVCVDTDYAQKCGSTT